MEEDRVTAPELSFEPITYDRKPDVRKAVRWALSSGAPAGQKLEALARDMGIRAVPRELTDEAVAEWEAAGCPEPLPGPWR